MLGAEIQRVTVFDTSRATVTRTVMRPAKRGCNESGANTLIPAVAQIELTVTSLRNSAVQELLSVGWGSV